MTRHYEGRIHWAKIFKLVHLAGTKGIAIYDVCSQLDLNKNDPELEKTVQQLVRQGRVRLAMGMSKNRLMCRVLTEAMPHESARSLLEKEGELEPRTRKASI